MTTPNYETFSQCLSRILEKRGLSSAQLSHMLHHKSKTTLFRVFQNQAGSDSLTRVYNELLKCNELHLNETECQDLYTALTISQDGLHTYRAQIAMWDLLRQKPYISVTAHLDIPSKQMNSIELSAFFAQLSQAQNAQIIMINCCWYSVIYELTQLLDSTKSTVSIQHYIKINSDTARTINVIHNILPLISYVNYMGYSIYETSVFGNTDTMNVNAIIIRTDNKGITEEHQILMYDDSYGTVYTSSGIFDYWSSYISKYTDICFPVKTVYPSAVSASDYAKFTENYYQMEANRNIYMYKPDLCINYVNADIAKSALIDGVSMSEIELPEIDKVIDELVAIQRKRFNNIFHQKRVTHCIYSANAMKSFAKTGVHTDHFFAMRPFTVTERIEILSHMVNQMEHNPYFNIHLLKDEDTYKMIEATCFEGVGIRFTSANTDYNLSNGHTEAIITQKEFMESFVRFFIDELLKKHTQPVKNTVMLFNALIAELASNITN